ncbi:bifunctional transcriptional activator/DNA repair enzyme AdaA [Motiliproteus sp. SC1-56]|uniref:bifunctional transcriptional activator/DNA repair enzyme AdaA n=1 Tax=Motiliproteus sp. SC1-56 TaxID=2799565 RepID=UPI001A8E48B7|nr:methylated-DNA--[protein]-cysteine S-methyltransferase [Motiliproteus sp. SC1-56]
MVHFSQSASPDQEGDAQGASPPPSLLRVARYIETHAHERLSLERLAKEAGLSPGRFQRHFKAAFGISPKVYQDAVRLGALKSALKTGHTVTEAIFEAGFGSTSRVYGASARQLGMPPKVYRRGGEGESISYACRETALGPTLMAATDRGVCFLHFGDSPEALRQALFEEFPKADIHRSEAEQDSELTAWIVALDRHLKQNGPCPELPLDMRGTALQMMVWRFLLGVKPGQVLSYSELASAVGRPRAVRAVASACGANRIGVLVPCHRVLRSDGGLGGYRWGLDRKRWLLRREGAEGAE